MGGIAILTGRCNPYGAETGGPARVLGGLYGPRSATTPGMGLPTSVEQGEWPCQQPAQVRCRMICAHGHRGQVMQLCSWHDEPHITSQPGPGGTFRPVAGTIRQHGHFEEIQKRQAGLCPRCAFPTIPGGPDYAQLMKDVQAWQAELSALYAMQMWRSPDAIRIRQAVEDASRRFDEGRTRGLIHNCPLRLVPIS